MCIEKSQLESILKQNNLARDKNLSNKLQQLKEEIFEKVDYSINKRMNHLSPSPETLQTMKAIQDNCTKTSNEYNLIQQLMQRDIRDIKKYIEEDAQWKKETWDKIEKEFVSTEEFKPFKEKVNKLTGFLWGLLVACAIIVASYVLIHVGLPTL